MRFQPNSRGESLKRANFKLSLQIPHINSVAATQMSIGRGLKRTVDMFRAPREMVEENDRRNELVGIDDPEASAE